MREQTIKLYDINEMKELFPEVYADIIERYQEMNVDYDWWDFIFEGIEEKLQKYGMTLDMKKTTFDLGYPYNSLTLIAEVEDAEKLLAWIKKEYPESYDAAWKEAIKLAKEDAYEGDTEDDIKENAKDILHDDIFEVYGSGSKDEGDTGICEEPSYLLEELQDKGLECLINNYEYLMSDEAIHETLDANDFEFMEDGRTF